MFADAYAHTSVGKWRKDSEPDCMPSGSLAPSHKYVPKPQKQETLFKSTVSEEWAAKLSTNDEVILPSCAKKTAPKPISPFPCF